MMRISTGAKFLDDLLKDGYDNNIVTTLYGPSGSGKTNLCLICAVNIAKNGKKVILIDTEGGICVERIKQLSTDYEQILKNIIFFNPISFVEQNEIFETLRSMINDSIGMIIVDSISMLYRLELGRSDDVYDVNASLGRQIAYLVEIARTRRIPVLITNQVYSDFDNRDEVKMVGGDLLKYGSKCLIELKKFNNVRGLILRKHRSLPEGLSSKFKIIGTGVEKLD